MVGSPALYHSPQNVGSRAFQEAIGIPYQVLNHKSARTCFHFGGAPKGTA